MRIAIIHSYYGSAAPSGENSQVDAELDALSRAGHDVHLVAAFTDVEAKRRLYSLKSGIRVATGVGASPVDELRRLQPDIIHIHNLFPNFGRRWASASPAPFIATMHNFRFVCASGILMRDGRYCDDCVASSSLRGLVHGCYRGSRVATAPLSMSLLRGPARDPVLKMAAKILCLSARQRALLLRSGLPAERLEQAFNFLPADLDPGSSVVSAPRTGWVFVGRLSPEKGILELVQRWPHDGPHLTVIGEGEMKEAIEHAAVGKPITVSGAMSRSRIIDSLVGAIGLVLPSQCPEVAPLVVIEALASGARILVTGASDVGDPDRPYAAEQVIVRGDVDCVGLLRAEPVAVRAAFESRFSEGAFLNDRTRLYQSVIDGNSATRSV